jgi:hypothetical protein
VKMLKFGRRGGGHTSQPAAATDTAPQPRSDGRTTARAEAARACNAWDERRAVDAIFRACPVEVWPGYSKPMIRVSDFVEWRERCTYRGDRVRPT